MRFLKVFVFVLLFFLSCNSMALTNAQKNYLMQEKGYTGEQIQAYEDKVAANTAARKAGQEITPLTDSETQMVNYAKSSEAIQYGNEAGLWEQFQAGLAESTGMADKDMTGVMDALDTAGEVSTIIGMGALGAAGGVAGATLLGAGAVATTAAGVTAGAVYAASVTPWQKLLDWWNGKQETSFPTILNAFTSSNVGNGCWFCGVFETLFTTINNLAVKTNDSLSTMIVGDGWAWNSTYSLLGLLLFGYIIFTVGKAFFSFKLTEPMELFSQVFFPTMRCMIAALLIWNIQSIYTYMLDPLLSASIGFGTNILDSGKDTSGYSASASLSNGAYVASKCRPAGFTLNNSLLVNITGGPTAEVDFSNPYGTSGTFYEYAPTNPGLSKNVNQAIQCFLDTASQNLITWMAVGASFIADCWKIALKNFFGSIQMFIIGLIIFIGSFLIFLAFPLKLLDSMFRLMFITALMPLWIAFWVIPQTRKFTNKAWGMLEHVLITFIVLSVILVMVLTIIEKMFDKSVSGIDIETIAQALLRDKSVKGLEYINFTGVGIFMTAALMYLAFSLIGKTDSFVSHFASGGGDMGMGKEVAGRATQGAQLVGAVGAAGVAASWRFLNKKRGGSGEQGPGGSAGHGGGDVGTAPAPHRDFGGGSTGSEGAGPTPSPTGTGGETATPFANGTTGAATIVPSGSAGRNSTGGRSTSATSLQNDNRVFADPDSEGAEASGSAQRPSTNQRQQNQNSSRSNADNRVFADPESEGAEASGSASVQPTSQNQTNQNTTTTNTATDNRSFSDPDSEGADR